jgi:hypothetical protein
MATSANEYETTSKEDGVIVNDESTSSKEDVVQPHSTVTPDKVNEMMTVSTAIAPLENQLDIDQNTGEEMADEDVSTTATFSAVVDTQLAPITTSIAATIINNAVDENTGEEVYKEPIDGGYQQIPQNDASNDVAASVMSTTRPTGGHAYQTSPIPESQTPSLNGSNNSIDGLISIHMSSNENVENDRDSLWLEAHNTRRKQWHRDNDVKYVPLSWSTDLVSSALTRAQVLIDQPHDTIELYHDENNHQEGENLALNCGSGSYSSIRTPDNILNRWVEKEIGMSPPDNLHLIQVLWRATTLVGCAETMKEYDDGSACHVQVCRYSKTGNCNLGNYEDWSIPMLLDDSPC